MCIRDSTINDPSDTDKAWYVEIAFPLDVLAELNGNRKPAVGDQWRVNFSRVEWHTTIVNGKYVKEKDPISGKILPEENWVWSPQGVVAVSYTHLDVYKRQKIGWKRW